MSPFLNGLSNRIGERREQIGEDALGGEADGDAADAEAGDQRGDVHAQIVEDQDARDREQGDADQHADDRHRIAERAGASLLGDAAADHAEDQLAAPDRALEGEGDGEPDVDQMRRAVRQVGVSGDDVGGGDDHEDDAGLGEHRPITVRQLRLSGSRATAPRPSLRSTSMTATSATPTTRPISSPSRLAPASDA